MKPPGEKSDISEMNLDKESGISIIERVDTALRAFLSVLTIGDQVDSQPKRADFETVIATVRELGAALAPNLGKPEYQNSEALSGFTRGLRSGLYTTLITLEYLASVMGGASAPSDGPLTETHPRGDQVETDKRTADLLVLYKCKLCRDYHEWGSSGTPSPCRPGSAKRFRGEELDQKFPGGWIRRPPPNGGSGDPPPSDSDEGETKGGKSHPEPQRSTGMREGSNGDKIYQATKNMLMKNKMIHIDDIFIGIETLGLFGESVKDRRVRLSNLLSRYKAKGLMTSDGRGNWSLLDGEAKV
jgi:hypothetical protein